MTIGPDAAQVVKIGDAVPDDKIKPCKWCGELGVMVPDEAREEDCCSWECLARLFKEMRYCL
ncbi:MAG TPA: hypothetical protein EYN64_02830 [Flavobacteriales bacterium]|nr:hypothetical protein [Flavobacteriales bacterium]